jgi:hypothetical protein
MALAHWKSISRVNDILVFVVNTRVINRLFKCEGLLVNARRLSAPQKWKDQSTEDLDFRLCNLGLHTIKRGCSMKSWGEIMLVLITSPLCNFLEIILQKSCCWRFSGRRLQPSEPETPACKGNRLWFWAGDFGQRIWPPKLVFHPSGASLWSHSGVSEETGWRLWVFAPGSRRLRLKGRDVA